MKDQLYKVISLLAIVAYFVPIIIVMAKKLWKDSSVFLFALYWLAGGLINLSDRIPWISYDMRMLMTVIYNMLDVPLLLLIFYFTTSSLQLKRFIKAITPVYIFIELVNLYFRGFSYESLKYVMGLGVIVALVVISWEVLGYLKKMEHSSREKAVIFIYTAMLFEYGTYIVIYIFDFYLKVEDGNDTLLIYYISSLIGVGIASFGFLSKDLKKKPVRLYRFEM